jgi:hypothetical protein
MMIKKIAKIVAIVLVCILLVAFAAPFLFKNKILALVKKEVNQQLNATVNFSDVSISFFSHFPKVGIEVDNISIVGKNEYSTDTLLMAKSIDVAVNFMSIVKGQEMKVYSINCEAPIIHAIINKAGKANWDIVKPDSSKNSIENNSASTLQLNYYSIHAGTIFYTDETLPFTTNIAGLNHEGEGDFTLDKFVLQTQTVADEVSIQYAGIPYLYKAKVTTDAAIEIDNTLDKYSFALDKILVNNIGLSTKGYIVNKGIAGYMMDILFKTTSTGFKDVLSLVPVLYKNQFDKITAKGTAVLNGFVKGLYSDNSLPAYQLALKVNDGYFKYSDLPTAMENIQVAAVVSNPDGSFDNSIVNVERATFTINKEPFECRLLVKNPISNLYVDAAAKGKIDFDNFRQFVKLSEGTTLKGQVQADLFVKGNVQAIEQKKLDQFTAGGTANISNLVYVAKDYPTGLTIHTANASFAPQKIDVSKVQGKYLGTNFTANAVVNNLLNYLFQHKPLQASVSLNADKIRISDWLGTSTDTTVKGAAASAFVVPQNVDILLNTQVEEVQYDNIQLRAVKGTVALKDEAILLNKVQANVFDGTAEMSGTYSTKFNKQKPAISFTYQVDKVDVQKTFTAFNTFQKLMPIGKFIAGKLTSTLVVNGNLGDNMLPDYNSLTGNGNLLLIEGFLSKFAPVDKAAAVLGIKELDNISLKEVKNYIEFANGKVLIKPFKVQTNGVDMEIGGMQGFNQSINYVINAAIPRALMGTKGNDVVNNLVSQVNQKGVPLKVGDKVNIVFNINGFLSNPAIKTNLRENTKNLTEQLKQQAVDFAKAKVDSTKTAIKSAAKDTIASLKKQAVVLAKDEIAKQIFGNNNRNDSAATKPKPIESVKGLINDLFKKKKKDTSNKQ